ncbi:MAG: nucleoside kinase [Clostridiaceae bacterium]|jgi:uridine kinase|nr:nucleoside kinase [Clostridiaceae bacterium]
MGRIESCLKEYKSWCEKLGIQTISDVNRIIKENKTNWLINISEIWHEQNISEIAREIKDNVSKKKIVLISGPSSSGKTTFANKLQLHLEVLGIKAVSISLDNYYKQEKDMPRNSEGKPDYEALESIDYFRFNENIEQLISGRQVNIPIYSFEEKLTTQKSLLLEKDEVIIVEGIHGLNDKLTFNIPADSKYKVYCSALTALSYDDGTRIKSRTNRLIRRIIRDYFFRNSSYQFTLELWPNVESGAQENIFPFTDSADVIFNSSLLYELSVYKSYLNNIFAKVSKQEANYEKISELLGLVNHFESIDTDLTPKTSLLREFVGGSNYTI